MTITLKRIVNFPAPAFNRRFKLATVFVEIFHLSHALCDFFRRPLLAFAKALGKSFNE